eukprot:5048815-Amphidinium_carterae.1
MNVGGEEHEGFKDELLIEVRRFLIGLMGGDTSLVEETSPGGYYRELWRRWLAVSKTRRIQMRQLWNGFTK